MTVEKIMIIGLFILLLISIGLNIYTLFKINDFYLAYSYHTFWNEQQLTQLLKKEGLKPVYDLTYETQWGEYE